MLSTKEEGAWEDGDASTCLGCGVIAEKGEGGDWVYRQWRREEMHGYVGCGTERRKRCAESEVATVNKLVEKFGTEAAEAWVALVCCELPKWFLLHLWRNGVDRAVFAFDTATAALEFVALVHATDLEYMATHESLVKLMHACTTGNRFREGHATAPMSQFTAAFLVRGVLCHKNHTVSRLDPRHWDAIERMFLDPVTKAVRCTLASPAQSAPPTQCSHCRRLRVSAVYDARAVTMTHARPNLKPEKICHCRPCWSCLVQNARRPCGGCRTVLYCSKQCQTSDWRGGHKRECKNLRSGDACTRESSP